MSKTEQVILATKAINAAPDEEVDLIGNLLGLLGTVDAPALRIHQEAGLTADDLSCPYCRAIFSAALDAEIDGEATPDWGTVCADLGTWGRDFAVLCNESSPQPRIDFALESARKIRALAERRSFATLVEELSVEVEAGRLAPDDARARISEGTKGDKVVSFRSLANIAEVELLDEEKRRKRLVRVGVRAIDDMIGGLARGGLTVLAAAPGKGKSSFALHVVRRAAGDHDGSDWHAQPLETGHKVAVFSLEMGEEEVAGQLVAASTLAPAREIHGREPLTTRSRREIERVAAAPWAQNVKIAETPGLDLKNARLAIAKAVRMEGCSLIVVDYLQLMRAPKSQTRDIAIGEITRTLKALARRYSVPIVILAQLNREGQDPAQEPRLSNLRESGNIEQDASEVLFLHGHRTRPEISPGADEEARALESDGPIFFDVILAKSRFGRLGRRTYEWERRFNRFHEKASNQDSERYRDGGA